MPRGSGVCQAEFREVPTLCGDPKKRMPCTVSNWFSRYTARSGRQPRTAAAPACSKCASWLPPMRTMSLWGCARSQPAKAANCAAASSRATEPLRIRTSPQWTSTSPAGTATCCSIRCVSLTHASRTHPGTRSTELSTVSTRSAGPR
ncbi:hypothetical protein DIPPA_64167 [Diplonema papillatum]|nr:hypothetical protein DIPPA_64167 [Diplonema papillatum]